MLSPVSLVIPVRNILEDSVELWLQVREENKLLEFPGGKVENLEKPSVAALRELEEETGVKKEEKDLRIFKQMRHSSLHFSIYYIVTDQMKSSGWVKFEFNKGSQSLKEKTFEVNYQIIDEILEYFQKQYREVF